MTTISQLGLDLSSEDSDEAQRRYALFAAIFHHGLCNLANGSIPPRLNTLLETADKFYDYLVPPSD